MKPDRKPVQQGRVGDPTGLSRFVLAAVFLLAGVGPSMAQNPSEKAARIHEALRERPEGKVLFERFLDAWLETDSLGDLESFVRKSAEAEDATDADRLIHAFFLIRQGDEESARAIFSAHVKKDPGDTAIWLEKAKLEARALEFEAALRTLGDAEKSNAAPEVELALEMGKRRAEWLLRLDRSDEALAVVRDLRTRYPDDNTLTEDLIQLVERAGNLDEAVRLAEEWTAAAVEPHDRVERLLETSRLLRNAEREKEAIERLVEAFEKTGAGSWLENEVLQRIESGYRARNEITDLVAFFQDRLIPDHPDRIGLRRRLANLWSESKKESEAIAAWKEILKRTPGDRSLRQEFVSVLERFGRFDQALEELDRLVTRHPEDAELRFECARLAFAGGDRKGGIDRLEKFLAVAGQDEAAFLRGAAQLEQNRAFREAEDWYRRALMALPENEEIPFALAAYLYRSGEKTEAVRMWRKLAEPPGDLDRILRVARALAGTGSKRLEAFEVLQDRANEFKDEPVFQLAISNRAISAAKFAEAIPWLRMRIEAAQTPPEQLALILELGVCADRSGQVLRQLKRIEARISESGSRRPPAWLSVLQSELHECRGDRVLAIQSLDGTEPENELALRHRVSLMVRRRDFSKGAEAQKNLIGILPRPHSTDFRTLAELHGNALESEAALVAVREWKKIAPADAVAWREEARLLEEAGKEKEAADLLERASRRFPEDDTITRGLAAILIQIGGNERALDVLWRRFESAEDLESKLLWVADLARLAADEPGGLDDRFQERAKRNPASLEPWISLAQFRKAAGDSGGRVRAILEARKLHGGDIRLAKWLASALEETGDPAGALGVLEEAASRSDDPEILRMLAARKIGNGDVTEGRRILKRISEAGMTHGEARSFSRKLLAQSDAMPALEFIERSILERFPKSLPLRFLHATALAETGQRVEARRRFLRLLQECQNRIPLESRNFIGIGSSGGRPATDLLTGFENLTAMGAQTRYAVPRLSHLNRASSPFSTGSRRLQVRGAAGQRIVGPVEDDPVEMRLQILRELRELAARINPKEKRFEFAAEVRPVAGELAELLIREPHATGPSEFISLLENRLRETRFGNEAAGTDAMANWIALQRHQPSTDPFLFEMVFDAFRESHPRLALLAAAWPLAKVAETHGSDLFERTENRIGPIENPVYELLEDLSAISWRAMGRISEPISARLGHRTREISDRLVAQGVAGGYRMINSDSRQRLIFLAQQRSKQFGGANSPKAGTLLLDPGDGRAPLFEHELAALRNVHRFDQLSLRSPGERDAYIFELLAWTEAAGRRVDSLRVIRRMIELTRAEVAAGRTGYVDADGMSAAGAILQVVPAAEISGMLGLMLDMLRDDPQSEYSIQSSLPYILYPEFAASFTANGGGRVIPESIEIALRETCPDYDPEKPNSIAVLPLCQWMLRDLGTAAQVPVINLGLKWIENPPEDQPLAREFAMASCLHAMSREKWLGIPADLTETQRRAWDAYALEVLTDERVSRSWRIGFAWFVLGHSRVAQSDAFVRASGKLVAEALNGGSAVTGEMLTPIFQAFLRLDREDDSWRETALRIAAGWKKEMERGIDVEKGRGPWQPDGLVVYPMLELLAEVGDSEQTGWLMAIPGNLLADNEDAVLSLLNGGAIEAARGLIGPDLFGHTWFLQGSYWSKATAGNLPELLALFPDEESRYFVELVLSSAPDSPLETRSEASTQSDRLSRLARRFGDVPFEDLEKRCLSILASHDDSAAVVAEPLADLVSEHERSRILNNTTPETRDSIIIGHMVNRMKEADASAFIHYVLMGQSRVRQLAPRINRFFDEVWATASKDQIADWLPLFKDLVSRLVLKNNGYGHLVSRQLVAHALADEMEDLNEWRLPLSPGEVQQLRNALKAETLVMRYLTIALAPESEKRAPKKERCEVLRRVFADPMFQEIYRDFDQILSHAVTYGLLTLDEALEIAPELAEIFPRFGYGLGEVAQLLCESGEFEKGMAVFNEALKWNPDASRVPLISAFPEFPDPKADVRIALNRARIVGDSGDPEEAVRLLLRVAQRISPELDIETRMLLERYGWESPFKGQPKVPVDSDGF